VAADPVLNLQREVDYAGAGLNSAECLPLGDVVASFADISVPAFLSSTPLGFPNPYAFSAGTHLQQTHAICRRNVCHDVAQTSPAHEPEIAVVLHLDIRTCLARVPNKSRTDGIPSPCLNTHSTTPTNTQ
jgi:hypothetical protein